MDKGHRHRPTTSELLADPTFQRLGKGAAWLGYETLHLVSALPASAAKNLEATKHPVLARGANALSKTIMNTAEVPVLSELTGAFTILTSGVLLGIGTQVISTVLGH